MMMKKLIRIALCLLLFLSAAGCGRNPTVETEQQTTVKEVYVGQKYFTVDTAARTIYDEGQNTYSYRIAGTSISVTYPNGNCYCCTDDGQIRTGYYSSESSGNGESPSLGTAGYASGFDLVDAVEKAENVGIRAPSKKSGNENNGEKSKLLFYAIPTLVLGIFGYSAPEKVFQFRWGRKIKDAQPTDSYLRRTKVASVLAIILGIIALICGLSM